MDGFVCLGKTFLADVILMKNMVSYFFFFPPVFCFISEAVK